jgi:hypothetical protein
MAFTNLEETDMVLIYGEARDIQSQHGKSTVKGFLEEYFPIPMHEPLLTLCSIFVISGVSK